VSIEIAGHALAAAYEREVAASLDRVWENVLDWEHLPWLHRSSFLAIREVEAGPLGWRACVLLPHPTAPRPAWIEVKIDRASRRYVTRTLAGVGQGAEIWTCLEPVAERRTRITVEFHLPFSGPTGNPGLGGAGAAYTALYTRLWDEDESMMVRRQEVLDACGAPASPGASVVPLGSASSLRAELPRVVDVRGTRIRIVEVDGTLCAHTTVCPHLGGPLEEAVPDADGCIVCPWHGYRFDLRTGRRAGGHRLALPPGPTLEEDAGGEVRLVWHPS
jgi:nitrite reductase/ring-hydroxylating ferredoxin subunit